MGYKEGRVCEEEVVDEELEEAEGEKAIKLAEMLVNLALGAYVQYHMHC